MYEAHVDGTNVCSRPIVVKKSNDISFETSRESNRLEIV
jgi:hypothetical protein